MGANKHDLESSWPSVLGKLGFEVDVIDVMITVDASVDLQV